MTSSAQTTTTIWATNFIPEAINNGPTSYYAPDPEFDIECIVKSSHDPYGSISDDNFAISGTSYTVLSIRYGLSSSSNPKLHLTLDNPLSSSDLGELIFYVGSRSFRLSTATNPATRSNNYTWADVSSLPWTVCSSTSFRLDRVRESKNIRTSKKEPAAVKTSVAATPTAVPRTCDAFREYIVVSGADYGAQCQHVGGAGIGNAQIIEAGYIDAVDVWSYVGPGLEVCFPGRGSIILLDAATAPRSIVAKDVYYSTGMTCSWVDRPGTVIFMSSQSAAADLGTTEQQSLQGCMVATTEILNFRDGPAGNIIGVVAYDATFTAIARTPDWFNVDYHGAMGWISADYVTVQGNCGSDNP